MEKETLWEEIIHVLRQYVEPNAMRTWFKHANIYKLNKDEIVIHAANEFAADWLRKHFFREINNAVEKVLQRKVKVVLSYQDDV
ncbi:hypothetical protein J6TS2_23090 [Heyndrickxia sporothermodurans]|nr:hypothetical protein J6TS2_23090 [Heyndrickxia sporothermodurans]